MESVPSFAFLQPVSIFLPKYSLLDGQPGVFLRDLRRVIKSPSLRYKSHAMGSQNTLKSVTCILEKLCNVVEDFIDEFMDRPLRPWVDPQFVLGGNFAPVEETPPVECPDIEGILPECIEGIYVRNGPNPRYAPRSGHHYFEGDGMLHALTIKNGRLTFCSRYVRTNKFVQEDIAGRPIFPKVFSGFYGFAGMARFAVMGARVALGQIKPSEGFGLAGTSVVWFDNKLMALDESDLPYAVRVTENGDVQTIGRYDFDGKLCTAMTAHPKIDPDTGEMFAFRYGVVPPFLNFFRVAPNGEIEAQVPIRSLRRAPFMHDFAITKRYAIFPDTQIVLNLMDMVLGKGPPIGYDSGKVPRLGIIPRYATDESDMKWFEVPGLNVIHTLNAWDEGDDEIVLIASNSHPVQHMLERMHSVRFSVEKIRISLKSGSVIRKRLSSKSLELGVINQLFVSKKNRYCYTSVGAPFPRSLGVAKLDFDLHEECVVSCRIYGEDWFGSEPYFVNNDANAEEDGGYVVTFTHNERTGESKFVVMDAQSPTLQIVASVKLPVRVPYGFHGLFVPDKLLFDASLPYVL